MIILIDHLHIRRTVIS